MNILHVKGERPKEVDGQAIPDHWLIMNAPRPLYASFIGERVAAWEGDFLHGRFYVACDPGEAKMIEQNVALDAWQLQWHSEEEINAWVKADYAEKYPGERIFFTDFEQRDFDNAFFLHHNRWLK
jgi:hypothetical protein